MVLEGQGKPYLNNTPEGESLALGMFPHRIHRRCAFNPLPKAIFAIPVAHRSRLIRAQRLGEDPCRAKLPVKLDQHQVAYRHIVPVSQRSDESKAKLVLREPAVAA